MYKYFPDVESILVAWHERQVESHLAELMNVKDRFEGAWEQLEAVLHAYAFLSRSGHDHGDAVVVRLHQGGHRGQTRESLQTFLAELVRNGAAGGVFRTDVAPAELAAFCLHALGAATEFSTHEAVLRLVKVTLDALRPTRPSNV